MVQCVLGPEMRDLSHTEMGKRRIKPNNKFTSILSSIYSVLQQTAGARSLESAALKIIHLLDQNTRRG